MLLEITEPNQQPKRYCKAIGIDLGTTNSLVAYSESGKSQIIGDILPSIISYFPDKNIMVGQRHLGATSLSSVKRFMGKGLDNYDHASLLAKYICPHRQNKQAIGFDLDFVKTSPIEASAEILKSLKHRAEHYFSESITKTVITVPAYFDEEARVATKHAASLAGLEVLRLINEPTAAAVAYGLDKAVEGIYVVYDFGGGTFDISILNMQRGVFQVLATGGDTNLGGDDIDYLVADLIKSSHQSLAIEELYIYARQVKETLSSNDNANLDIGFSLSRQQFEQVISAVIDKSFAIMGKTLRDAQIEGDQVKAVILVGGSTRIPLIKSRLQKLFPIILDDINPEQVVALGAAIQAESLTSGSSHLLIDVTPLSLGLEIMGGLNERIIERNSPLPISITKDFTTYQDGQTGIDLHIIQGEREMVKDCRSLAKFELKNIPPMKAGIARVNVTFAIDADGILTVTANEASSGNQHIVDIKPTYGLDSEAIERMLIESMQNAEQDIAQRLLQESKINAQQLVDLVNKALEEDPELVSTEELAAINQQIKSLQTSAQTDNRNQIERDLQALESLLKDFGDRKMNKYIKLALQGKNITDI